MSGDQAKNIAGPTGNSFSYFHLAINSVVLNGGAQKEMDCWAEYGDK